MRIVSSSVENTDCPCSLCISAISHYHTLCVAYLARLKGMNCWPAQSTDRSVVASLCVECCVMYVGWACACMDIHMLVCSLSTVVQAVEANANWQRHCKKLEEELAKCRREQEQGRTRQLIEQYGADASKADHVRNVPEVESSCECFHLKNRCSSTFECCRVFALSYCSLRGSLFIDVPIWTLAYSCKQSMLILPERR